MLHFIEERGPHDIKLTDLYIHLQQQLPLSFKVPSLSTISCILREDFKMRFRAMPPAMTRYIDPMYDQKRQWVARLLGTFIMRGMVIISIDESHVRAESFIKRKWRFSPQKLSNHELIHGPASHKGKESFMHVPSYEIPTTVHNRETAEQQA